MISSEDPDVHLSPRARERGWGESVSATIYMLHKLFPASIKPIPRTWKTYRLGHKEKTARWDPLLPHCTSQETPTLPHVTIEVDEVLGLNSSFFHMANT